jgi:hypothetical protein
MPFIPWKTGYMDELQGFAKNKSLRLADIYSNPFAPSAESKASIAAKLFGTEGGPSSVYANQAAGMETAYKPSPFNLADAFGAQLVGGGAVKLFSQALAELFGKKKKKEKVKTFSDLFAENVAATPKRTSYLEEAMRGK